MKSQKILQLGPPPFNTASPFCGRPQFVPTQRARNGRVALCTKLAAIGAPLSNAECQEARSKKPIIK